MATLVLKNNTASVVTITDVGIVIPASSLDTYTDPETIVSLAGSASVRTLLTAATLTANDGSSDLVLAAALAYLELLWSRGGRDQFIQIPDLGGVLSDTQHGSRGAGTLHPASTPSTPGFMSAADKTKADASGILTSTTPAGIDVGDAATVGVLGESARADHQHALPAPAAPANVTKAAASAGVAATVARADHKHDVSTAAPAATGVATAPAEGVATTLARSDHAHQSNTAPANVTKAAAAIGTSGEPARADHKHDVTTAAAVAVAQANSEGTATSLSRSDHVHDHGIQPLGTGNQHAVATPSVAGFESAADKTKLDASGILTSTQPTQIDVGDAAVVGVLGESARADHQHALPAPAAPANVTKAAAAAGVATTVARSDHKHDVSTAAPAAVGVGTAAAEGAATTLARSDHSHQSNTAPANVTKAAAAIGTSGEPARADHKHDISTGVPVAVGAVNAEGVATTLSRSDHVHAAAAGALPGTWTQLGKGPTSIADDTEVTVLSGITLAAGEVPMLFAVMRTTPTTETDVHFQSTGGSPSGGTFNATVTKRITTGLVDFRIRHGDGATRTFDWVAFKVLPA